MKTRNRTRMPFSLTIMASLLATLGAANVALAASTFKMNQVQASADDAIENKGTGSVAVSDQYVTLQGNRLYGYRFANVDVPQGAVIKSAYLRFFNGNLATDGALNLSIYGEAVDNAAAFAATSQNISARLSKKTTANVLWSVPNWHNTWSSEDPQKSVDISAVISEIVSRPGFVRGNAISLILDSGSSAAGTRSTYSADYTTGTRMVRLVIEYEDTPVVCDHTPSILSNGTFIPNFSYAGYRWGEAALPDYTASSSGITFVDMTTMGATPNDSSDDTMAIRNALASYQNTPGTVVLHFPAGRYLVSNIFNLTRGNIVIQGEGSGTNGTVFAMAQPLSTPGMDKSPDVAALESEYNTNGWPVDNGVPYSLYSWLGGIFDVHYAGNRYSRSTLSSVAAAKRGETTFTIPTATSSIKVGDVIRFEWANGSDNNFASYLVNGDLSIVGSSNLGASSDYISQTLTVTAISANGLQITVKEPLLHDIGQPGQTWTARIRTQQLLDHVGLEHFRVEFPDSEYGGHHAEAGYNAIYLADVKHAWLRDISIHNADSGIIVNFSKNVTVQDINMTGRKGHYTMQAGRSYGILNKGFDYRSSAIHNPSFNNECTLCVYSDGYVANAAFDQHNGLNHQNLIDKVTVGYSSNLFDHGGNTGALPTAAQFNTFWNIQVQELPYNNIAGTCDKAPDARLVGLYSPHNTLSVNYSPAPVVDGLNACVSIPSLYNYQLQNRLVVPVTAAFSANQTSGIAPLAVQFTDASTGNATQWAWDFNNDGIVDSTVQHPLYTFNTPGSYSVKLTASNNNSSASELKTGYINVIATDTVPNTFSFVDVTSANFATVYTSNNITVSGINAPSGISISGGEYSVNGGAWRSSASTVANNDVVAVRLTSASTGSTTSSATLNIGGVSDTYSVTTKLDNVPNAFSFVDVTGANLNTYYISTPPIVVSGMDVGATATISRTGSGWFRVNGGAWTTSSTTVKAGDTVEARVLSSKRNKTSVSITVTINGVSDTYQVTTK